MTMWLGFIVCTALIFFSGKRLSIHGDVIAEKSGMGRTWIGLILMASVTSLPELVSGISAVTIADVPNIAVGGVVGSCVFNLTILVLLDCFVRGHYLLGTANPGNALSASFGVLLISIVIVGMSASNVIPGTWVGYYSIVIIITYFVAMRVMFRYEKTRMEALADSGHTEEEQYGHTTLNHSIFHYILNSAIVVVAAIFLPIMGEAIAKSTGLGETFVGNIFIAFSTSLPEVVVSIAAVKIGAIDMAIGNIFGSNIFNILILAINDMFYTKGSILATAEPQHLYPAMAAIAMSAVAGVGLMYRDRPKKFILGPETSVILVLYFASTWALFTLR